MTTPTPKQTTTVPTAPLVLSTPTPAATLTTSVQGFNAPLAVFLEHHALPTQNVLMPLDERKFVINALEDAIACLPHDEREKAFYLTKFVVAVSTGLFDAALNYLWNETVLAMRRTVATIDLAYFFDIAEKRQDYRKRLVTVDDLPRVEDASLIDACGRIGILSPVNVERLRHINYMRNHASAAHPNANDLTGPEMVGWLSNCLRYAITAKADPAVLQTQQLLVTVRERTITSTDVVLHESELRKMERSRVDDLLWTLFGLYTDASTSQSARDNVALLAPVFWKLCSEQRRVHVGIRHADFARRGDVPRRDHALNLLKLVDGEGYRTTEVLVPELLEKLRALRAAHNGANNFYNEAPHAAALEDSLPITGIVPKPVLNEWVSGICTGYIGNGHGYRAGVDEGAIPHYDTHIKKFGDREMVEFLKLMAEEEFVSDLHMPKAQHRAKELAKQLRQKAQDVYVQQGLDAIAQASTSLRNLGRSQPFGQILAALPNLG